MLTDGLVEFWTLNNTRVGDVAGILLAAPDGTDNFVTGKIGQAWDAVGNANKRLVQSPPLFPFAGPFSYSLWMKWAAVGSSAMPIRWIGTPSAALQLSVNIAQGNRWKFTFGSANITSSVAQILGEWQHVIITYDPTATNKLTIFVNGVATSGAPSVTPPSAVTAINYAGGLAVLNGPIDCIGFWTRALAQADVDALYNSGAGWEPDRTPDGFAFTDVTGAARNSQYETDIATLAGIDIATPISVADGEYSVNGGAYTAAAGRAKAGDTVRLRRTSSADWDTAVAAVLTVGTYSTTWTIRTGLEPSFPTLLLSPAI